ARSMMLAGRKVTQSTERRPAEKLAAEVPADVEWPALEDVSAPLDAPAPASQDSAAHLEPGPACHHRRPGKPLRTHPAATWWTAGSTERAAKLAMSEPPGSPEQRALLTEKAEGPLAARPAHRAGVEPARRFRPRTRTWGRWRESRHPRSHAGSRRSGRRAPAPGAPDAWPHDSLCQRTD